MANKRAQKNILDILFEKGVLKSEAAFALKKEAEEKEKTYEEILYEKNAAPEKDILEAKSVLLKVPAKSLAGEKISLEILKEVSEEAAKHYGFIPISKTGNILEVGVINPEDVTLQESLKFIALRGNLTVKQYLISKTDFEDVLKQYRSLGGEVTEELEKLKPEEELAAAPKGALEKMAEEAPITKMVGVIIKHAVEGRASDIHIEPVSKNLRVRFRMDGVLYTSLLLPLDVHQAIVSRIKILSNLKIDETRVPQDGRFHTKFENKEIDFRVSTFPTAFGEKVVMRILDPEVGIKELKDLGITGRNAEVLKKAIDRPYGLILITGPTGSGKSTTLYALLKTLNKDDVNIVSLEDPVEYYMEGINQSQIRPEIGYDFATGLRHILRQDPDVIMVGEIRDKETAALAIHAALTGHLVFATLHTNTAVGVIPRLIDMGVDPFLIAPTLIAAVGQRLTRKLCQDSKQEYEPDPKTKEMIMRAVEGIAPEFRKEIKIPSPLKIFKGVESPTCPIGTKGRMGVYEILEMTPELEKIILSTPSESKIEEEARRQGMITMWQDGITKALEGVIGIEQLLEISTED